jgi:poly(A) polymerase Pap1
LILEQDIEMNKVGLDALFELRPFFDSYINYLQIDIVVADQYELRTWKGWVES